MFVCESMRNEDYCKIINNKINTTRFDFINYEVAPLSKKSGIFGEHYILKLNVKRKNGKVDELKYFLKTLPQLESQRNFTVEMGAFFKEEQMFKLFVPLFLEFDIKLMKKCAPKCYLTQPNEMLIFEDLSSKGYTCLNPRKSYDLNLVKLTINSMAHLHASGLILEEKLSQKTGITWRLYDEYPEEFQEMLYSTKKPSLALIDAARKGTLSQIDLLMNETNLDGFKKFAEESIVDLIEYVKPSKYYRNAICHGDLWAANIMIQLINNKPMDCVLVDFQSYRYCPPAQDLMTFLYLSTDRAFRQNHLQEVLEYYYITLKNIIEESSFNMNTIITYEDFMKSCESGKLFAVIQSVTHFQIVMMSPEGMGEFLNDADFNKRSMFEDRSDIIKQMCEKDEFYKLKQIESLADLKEYYDSMC